MRDAIFVSYAHADRAWLSELQHVLDRLPAEVRISIWDDTRIAPGLRWHGEIKEALDTAAAAVLLLSDGFFRSDFIATSELPEVLAAAKRSELTVLPVVLASCRHEAVTSEYQAVHDPALPLAVLDEPRRGEVWRRLLAALNEVAAGIGEEARIGAETLRLGNDVAASAEVAHVLDKMARARVDAAFDADETMRENTLVFLEGQRCQATATWLMEEMKRSDLAPARSKAIVRMLERVSREHELALARATELTQAFADRALTMLERARGAADGSS